jgi:predicted transcriptional regulator
MSTVKEAMTKIIQEQPEDASYEEIMRELAFERMIERGLEDSRKGRMISDEEMGHRIRSWQR